MYGCIVCFNEGIEEYIYHEGEGNRIGNDVVSLIHEVVYSKAFLVDTKENLLGEYLTFFYNCGVYKKNHMMFW